MLMDCEENSFLIQRTRLICGAIPIAMTEKETDKENDKEKLKRKSNEQTATYIKKRILTDVSNKIVVEMQPTLSSGVYPQTLLSTEGGKCAMDQHLMESKIKMMELAAASKNLDVIGSESNQLGCGNVHPFDSNAQWCIPTSPSSRVASDMKLTKSAMANNLHVDEQEVVKYSNQDVCSDVDLFGIDALPFTSSASIAVNLSPCKLTESFVPNNLDVYRNNVDNNRLDQVVCGNIRQLCSDAQSSTPSTLNYLLPSDSDINLTESATVSESSISLPTKNWSEQILGNQRPSYKLLCMRKQTLSRKCQFTLKVLP